MKRIMLLVFVATPCLVYLTMSAFLYSNQRDLQYFPDISRHTPDEVGAEGFTEVDLKAGTDARLIAWHKPAFPGRPTILFFHGNGGSIASRTHKIMTYAKNFGMLAVEYRGYGGNSGSPSEAGFVSDAHLAYDWLTAKGLKADEILILGESIGTGVAVQIAAAKPARAIALEAPYANAVDIGADIYWFLPVRLLMKDQYRSADHIKKITAPLFIIHGTEDRVVPFAQGRKLFELANEPKQFVEVPGVGHDLIGDDATWEKVLQFFEQHAQVRSD